MSFIYSIYAPRAALSWAHFPKSHTLSYIIASCDHTFPSLDTILHIDTNEKKKWELQVLLKAVPYAQEAV